MQEIKNKISTFWQAVSEYTIVIPQIQRDYAQGRNDKDSNYIRINILNTFFNSIIKSSAPIDIDFIYGYIRENEFIPLDGQQRLTTLFLLHWYLAKKSNSESARLNNFRYETRQSSTDFCKSILNATLSFEVEDLKKYIIDQRWFYHSWMKDPTVTSMLTMIQSIHLKFKEIQNAKNIWDNLIDQTRSPITFNFLEINDFGFNDDLYVKMNSRGKPLTRFENFKVWFQKKNPKFKEWQEKIDNEWTNLFWKYRNAFENSKNYDNTIDDEFMQFINGMLMYGLALNENKDGVLFFFNNPEISFSKYEEVSSFSNEEIVRIVNTLDWLCKYENEITMNLEGILFWQEKSIFEAFISNTVTYKMRVFFYAIVHYANNTLQHNQLSKKSFQNWMRVTRNLIENTDIDSNERFIGAIKSLTAIGGECLNIYEYLIKTETKISFFSLQVEEEKNKSHLVLSDLHWEKEILDAENHELFRGCIGFLLPSIQDTNLITFKVNKNIAKKIFCKDGSEKNFKDKYLLIRASLAKSSIVNNIRLIDNGENWRDLLKRKEMQLAIYSIINDFANIVDSDHIKILESIIQKYSDEKILWKYYIIKNEVLLSSDASRSKYIKEYWGFHYLFNNEGGNWINNNNQFLLSNYRNELISILLKMDQGIELEKNDNWSVKIDSVTKSYFFRGDSIWLKKNYGNFNLRFQFKADELIVGFSNNEKGLIEIKENNFEAIPDWQLAKSYSHYPMEEDKFEDWINEILNTMPIFEQLISVKSGDLNE